LIWHSDESVCDPNPGYRAPMTFFLSRDAVKRLVAEKILGRAPMFILNWITYASSSSKSV
jgi:hypothetical protein